MTNILTNTSLKEKLEILIQGVFEKGTKSWFDYSQAKKLCESQFGPMTSYEYNQMIHIITDWLNL